MTGSWNYLFNHTRQATYLSSLTVGKSYHLSQWWITETNRGLRIHSWLCYWDSWQGIKTVWFPLQLLHLFKPEGYHLKYISCNFTRIWNVTMNSYRLCAATWSEYRLPQLLRKNTEWNWHVEAPNSERTEQTHIPFLPRNTMLSKPRCSLGQMDFSIATEHTPSPPSRLTIPCCWQ